MSRRMFTCPFDTSKYRSSATDAEAARIDFARLKRIERFAVSTDFPLPPPQGIAGLYDSDEGSTVEKFGLLCVM